MPWLTPNTIPEAGICRPLWIPASSAWLAIVSGALTELTYAYNWEQFGDVTATEAAEAMQAMLDTYYSDSCSGGPTMPIGALAPYLTEYPPSGCVACDGSIYADTEYPDIWTLLDPEWKTDASHWQVPDLRDKFIVGAGNSYNPADVGGETNHTLTTGEMPNHAHYYSQGGVAGYGSGGGVAVQIDGGANNDLTVTTGGGGAHNNMPPYVAVKWCVRVSNA